MSVCVESTPYWVPYSHEEINASIDWSDVESKRNKHNDVRHWVRITCLSCGNEKQEDRAKLRCRIRKGNFTGLCRSCRGKAHLSLCESKDHPCWKGGKNKNVEGYVSIHVENIPVEERHLLGDNSYEYVLEHRYVMAVYLGRPLYKWEIVHHKNGNREDNRLSNLQLCCIQSELPHPPGQKVEDLVDWAKQILELYGTYGDNSHIQ